MPSEAVEVPGWTLCNLDGVNAQSFHHMNKLYLIS